MCACEGVCAARVGSAEARVEHHSGGMDAEEQMLHAFERIDGTEV
jgi:hypothetical protein